MPRSRVAYWQAKIEANRERDKRVRYKLRRLDWRVLRLWEHELKDAARAAARISQALQEIV
jgi:DNA mismatch endonuclease (patch repair protein)